MTATLVIGLLATPTSGAAGVSAPSADSRAQGQDASRVTAPIYTEDIPAWVGNGIPRGAGATLDQRSTGVRQPSESGVPNLRVLADSDAQDASQRSVTQGPSAKCSAHKAVRFYAGRVRFWRNKMGGGSYLRADVGQARRSCPRYLAAVLQRKARALRAVWRFHWDYRRWMPAWMIRLGQCEEHLNWAHYDGRYEGSFAFATTTWDGYRLPGYPSSAADATPRQQMNVVLRIAHKLGVADPWGCWRGPQHAWVRGGLPEYGFHG